ncbi:Transcriptional regulator [Hoeflea phototrophica DFL-43]|jgi:DNA-binding transcriptional LysR family regulator|uniref:Transcriptional regulator n=1 Tax=Hoeflea phototrophica (strain DSM 17068 / NCIMB 14078 / DFL-43) TaxID=411684 RepID=A9CYS8_HOEPD|nr:LysR family transcriptional regulator [Hoeflea phototrophica]EDQ31967.1 Transcriptional regulator [Hoeflea phototrophica DFL-43]EDQ34629.1 Transcriptional regulator [Hoeflea phototrophica DFL-43]
MDTLLSLRVFAEVAEHKNFSAVAERLGLSPAMTSKHVKHVEARVGARLLNRNSRNVSLTEAGAQYLQTIRPLLDELAKAEAQLISNSLSPRGTLRMSMPVWMSNPAFAKLLTAYHQLNPHVTFDVDLSGRKISMVEEGVDLALRVAFKLDEGLIARKLADVTFQLVAAPAFLDNFGRPKTTGDLNNAPMLAYDQVAADGRIKFGGEDGVDVKLRPILVSANESILHQAAVAGMGFAMLPNWAAQDDIEDGRLEAVLPMIAWPKLHIQAIYADRSYLPAKVRSFLDFLAGPDGFSSILK